MRTGSGTVVVLLLCAAAGLAPATAWGGPERLSTPDGRTVVSFALDGEGVATWAVARDGQPLLLPSRVSLDLEPGGPLGPLSLVGTETRQSDSTWKTVVGKSSEVRDNFRETVLRLREAGAPSRRIDLVFRAYDDGVALRYRLPEQSGLSDFTLRDEKTEMRFSGAHTAWAARYGSYTTSQEKEFDKITLDDIEPGEIVGLPLTVQVEDGPAVAVTEADLLDWAGMYVTGLEGVPHALVTTLSPSLGDEGVLVRSRAPRESPWRVLMIADRPVDLIASNLVLNLATPSRVTDTSWIEPGKCVFPWWPNFRVEGQPFVARMNTLTNLHYIRFAGRNGFPFLEFEPPWYGPEAESIAHPERFDVTKPLFDLDMPRILEYGREQGVRLVIWAHWKSLVMRLEEALDTYAEWGAAGMKVDFMDRDDQEMVRVYERIAREAARRRLVVTFHGAYKPTGLRRTYPNVLVHEGVLGAEYNKWTDRVTPGHNVTLPFTRMLAGPMDYTPGGFRNATAEGFVIDYNEPMVMGTRAHELAKYVVYESPIPMVSDNPAALQYQPGFDFIRLVPTSWDETRGLDGEVGEYVALARRAGDEWYVGAMTNWTARPLPVALSFLGPGTYEATLWTDPRDAGGDPRLVATSTRAVTAQDTLDLDLASGGGAAIRLVPRR